MRPFIITTKSIFLLFIFFCYNTSSNAKLIIKNIKDFGANGKDNVSDNLAFQKAALYFKNNTIPSVLIISEGNYIIGGQEISKSGNQYFIEQSVFSLTNASNLKIIGQGNVNLKYPDSLRFGSFDPLNGKIFKSTNGFYDRKYIAQLGYAFYFSGCNNISIENIKIDGNAHSMIFGGTWGDVGIQLIHYGFFFANCANTRCKNIEASNFCLDGMAIDNSDKTNNNFELINCNFYYNSRQALSWVGGNGLTAINCKFNFSGKGKFPTSAGAGLDIEAEGGKSCINGKFRNCEFVNNLGCGLVADSGPSSNMEFEKCTFWGVTSWSIWVVKPSYTFKNCNIYGSIVHCCNTSNWKEATKFYNCIFEDKKYKNQIPYGTFLVETDGIKAILFSKCTFNANYKKIMWYSGKAFGEEDKGLLEGCTINAYSKNYIAGDWFMLLRIIKLKDNTFNMYFTKENYINETYNKDLGGNKYNYNLSMK